MSPHHWLKALYVNNSPAHYSKVKTTLLNRWESFQLQTPKIKKKKSKPSYCPRTYQVRYCDLNKGWQQFRLDPNWTIECYRGLISTNYLTIIDYLISVVAIASSALWTSDESKILPKNPDLLTHVPWNLEQAQRKFQKHAELHGKGSCPKSGNRYIRVA